MNSFKYAYVTQHKMFTFKLFKKLKDKVDTKVFLLSISFTMAISKDHTKILV